ncbi:DEHA2A04334p [Debaryomyces hansenii CBS767]|uniref:DEHA2A04334p n=1 Tax=Debaryomyces hansenii (strain ATCC 36239 / CBS 767 / BCRC 21394 / JCM 1990 / NBRC 0083 / IGC 2968) TaxID=284592 RepID=Q6BZ59_DEBHA|nr:exosome component 3'-5' exonuclease [Debaryomyces hansenii CBS767]CAG84465.2 DEHA2A04334p [Debaryomyces hansenii CBS767]|eukprot:XP_456510.2 exosome component 3'-5' exonuclease [Debaryomyces hansenii CBS767]
MSDIPSVSTFDDILPNVVQTVRNSSSLAAQDINFYKSLDSDLSKKIDESAKSLLDISNKLIHCSFDDVKDVPFGKDNISSHANWNPIANVLDNIFEKIDIAFDQAQNANSRKANAEAKGFTYLEDSNTINDSSNKHQGKRMVKPQINFRNKVDNSETHPFKPKISSKPNELKSFDESTKLIVPMKQEESNDIDPEYYVQPYEFEIDSQPYPDSILTKKEPIPSKPWSKTSAIWVDSVDVLNEMISLLSEQSEIAIDLEHHDYRSYYGIVCLMQISSRDQDWIIDTLKLRDDLESLNKVFTNPDIVKVFHGAFMDIIWLQRDLGLYIVSLFDTYHASKKLGFPKFSLAYLLETFANFKTSKKYQLADWRIRPLSPPMLAYARSDTHFLLNIYDQLRNKLIDAGANRLQEVLYESRQVAKRRFEYTKFRPLSTSGGKVSCPVMANNPKEPFSSILLQYNVPYHKKPLIEALYNWRDALAKRDDESVRYIMSNQLLVSLSSLSQPVDVQKVLGVSNYISDYVRQNAKDLANLIENTLKSMADSDWELVDKWNDISKAADNDKMNISDDDLDKIISRSKAFEDIYAHNKNVLFFDGTELLSNKSALFSELLNNNNDSFSVEYDVEKNKVINHTSGDYKDRLDYASKNLQPNPIIISPEISHRNEQHDEPKKPYIDETHAGKSSTVLKDEEMDPNEVITLRKTQKQKTPKAEIKQTAENDAFDYNNANKILLDSSIRNSSRKEKPKKRSFDPYGKDAEGPKGAKKARRPNTGKTSTFSTKK